MCARLRLLVAMLAQKSSESDISLPRSRENCAHESCPSSGRMHISRLEPKTPAIMWHIVYSSADGKPRPPGWGGGIGESSQLL